MQRATISMFAQLVQSMGCKLEFQHLVNKHQSDKASKGFSSWSQFIAMLFCQLTGQTHSEKFLTVFFRV